MLLINKYFKEVKMGLSDALLGNASEIDISEVAEELAPIIGDT
jgi:hypothetical protein